MPAVTTVDLHSHFFPENCANTLVDQGRTEQPWLRINGSGEGDIMLGNRVYRPVREPLWNPAARLAEMDRNGIDIQVMCATPIMFAYGLPADQAHEIAMRNNDAAIAICAHAPARLKALAQVPLQDIDRACAEASRARSCGHLGVQIGNHLGNRNLDDPELMTFLSHCADIGAAVLVHPWDMMARERMPKYMLPWLVAMPAETHLSILSLILSGAFERLPRTLKLCFAHGGGSFAFQLGRVENAWHERDIVRQDCPQPPSHYVDRFHVDSVLFSEGSLALLVEVMGDDRVMLGSDHPFPLGENDVGALVRGTSRLRAAQKANIMGLNALRFLGLSE